MAEYLISVDDPIILGVQIEDGNPSVFPRAYVKNENGVAVAGSPFNLYHQSNGWYTFIDGINLVFPSGIEQMRVTYVIFENGGYTIESEYYLRDVDIYRDSVGSISAPDFTEINEKLEMILNSIASASSAVEIEGTVVTDEVEGIVQDEDVVGLVDEQDILGRIDDEETTITGIADDDDEIVGIVVEDGGL